LHIVPLSHTDAITGAACRWNVFRVANSNAMLANAVAASLIKNGGKRWYYITPDYAFGHNIQAGLEKAAAKLGGTKVGGDLTPLGATDFSSYLIKAEAARPDVVILLTAGDDAVNSMKQIIQFGFDKRFHVAGALQTQEVLEGLPPEARIGTWVFDWYWRQPNVPHVADFVANVRKKSGKVPTAATWLDYVAAWTYALVANQEKTLDAVSLAKALGGFALPPEVALIPTKPFYRAADHQTVGTSLYVGHAQPHGDEPEDLFHVDEVIDGAAVDPPEEESGCTMKWDI
jgi:branched-chain amino acid transport system substrate-binding protein